MESPRASRRPRRLDGEVTVVFAAMWQSVPTFHASKREVRRDDENGDIRRYDTRCGLLVATYNRAAGRIVESMTYVPVKHALAFGKPCRRCFPSETGE